MPFAVLKLHPLFAAEIRGADLREPPSAELVATVEAAMAAHAVVVLRDQLISDEQQIRFSRAFGPLELPPHMGMPKSQRNDMQRRIPAEMYDVSNLDTNGELLPAASLKLASNRANEEFHTDSSFNALPTKWSLLSARIVPPSGGDTLYVDTRAVYDALPDALRAKAEDAVAEHWFWKTRGRAGMPITDDMRRAMPAVPQKIVRTIPESGRKALLIGNHATHVLGWPKDEGERFLEELNTFAAQPHFIYTHKWRAGDLVIWDNRCTLHRATPYDVFTHKRDMRRTTINEHGPEISSTDALGIPQPE
ncbi:MAG TPA: TauD/TfdA family dioxygenase [Gammaproteobacteria bacterium]|nr:TauD/TfdA family dioxygenase [Gammaproteobacteria bacterium]